MHSPRTEGNAALDGAEQPLRPTRVLDEREAAPAPQVGIGRRLERRGHFGAPAADDEVDAASCAQRCRHGRFDQRGAAEGQERLKRNGGLEGAPKGALKGAHPRGCARRQDQAIEHAGTIARAPFFRYQYRYSSRNPTFS